MDDIKPQFCKDCIYCVRDFFFRRRCTNGKTLSWNYITGKAKLYSCKKIRGDNPTCSLYKSKYKDE